MTVTIQEIIDEPIKDSRAKIDGNFSNIKTQVDLSDAHVASTANPHNVTLAQVGAEPANANIQAHIGSTSNPHSVTATQVGKDTAQWNANEIQGIEVDTTGIADTNVLKYDSTSGKLIAGAASVVADLNDLDDVASPTPTTGDVLTFDGTNWVNEGFSATAVVSNEVPAETPNGVITNFSTGFTFVAGKIAVYINRTRLKLDEDYTEDVDRNGVTLTVAPTTGDDIIFDYLRSDNVLIGSPSYVRINETPSGLVNSSNTVYDTAETFISGTLQVYLNGQLQTLTEDYAETDSNTLTFVTAPATGDIIRVSYQTALTPAGNADTVDGSHLADIILAVKQSLYPVGSYYFNGAVTTNPATLLGFGTWTAVAGKGLMGYNASETEFDTNGKTGGAKTHSIANANLPRYDGVITAHGSGSATVLAGVAGTGLTAGASRTSYRSGGADIGGATSIDSVSLNIGQVTPTAISNLQPYEVAAIWRRTA